MLGASVLLSSRGRSAKSGGSVASAADM